jgi:hypothetical protein
VTFARLSWRSSVDVLIYRFIHALKLHMLRTHQEFPHFAFSMSSTIMTLVEFTRQERRAKLG